MLPQPPADAAWATWQVTSLALVDAVEGRVDLDILRRAGWSSVGERRITPDE